MARVHACLPILAAGGDGVLHRVIALFREAGHDIRDLRADVGIRTINGAYWLLVFMLAVLAINTVFVYAVRTQVYRAALAGFWVLAITIGTVRALRRLATWRREATKFARSSA